MLIVGVLLIAVLLFGCCASTAPSAKTPSSVTQESTNVDIMKQCWTCTKSMSYVNYGEEICHTDSDCLIGKATTAEICKSFESKTLPDNFRKQPIIFSKDDVSRCITMLASRTNDSVICITNDLGIDCVIQVAKANINPVACTIFMPDKKTTTECYKEYAGVIETNNALKETVYIFDVLHLNTNQLDSLYPEICVIWTDNNRCRATIAYFKKDAALCDESGTYKGECYAAIAMDDSTFDLSECDAAGIDYPACYFSVAKRTNDPSVCEKVPTNLKSNCIDEVARKSGNIVLCARIDDSIKAGSCVIDMINRKCPSFSDTANCNITEADCKTMGDVRALTGQTNLNPDNCYYAVATKNLDLNVCEKIGDSNARTQCTQLVGHVN